MQTWTLTALMIATLGSAAPAAAATQTRDIFVSPTTGVGIGSVWGVFIGVSQYKREDLNLTFADKDAEALHGFFAAQFEGRIPADQFKLLTNEQVTRGNVLRAVGEVLRRAQSEDLVILSLAMHGLPDVSGQDLYFLTYDADPNLPEDQGISRDDLHKQISRSKARKIVLFLDACHAGSFGAAPTLLAMRSANAADINRLLIGMGQAQDGIVVLSSSSAAERSQEGEKFCGGHGAFTCGLLTGLGGDADSNRNGLVEVRELYDYTYRAVKRATGGYQNPGIEGRYDNGLPLAYATTASAETAPTDRAQGQDVSPKQLDAILAELQALKKQMGESRTEERQRLQTERRKLELERQRLEAERERIAQGKQPEPPGEQAPQPAEQPTPGEPEVEGKRPQEPQVASVPPFRPRHERRVFQVSLAECMEQYNDDDFLSFGKGFCKVEKRKAGPGEKVLEGTSKSFDYYLTASTATVDIEANVDGYTISYWRENPGEDWYLDHEYYIGQAIEELTDQQVTVVVTSPE